MSENMKQRADDLTNMALSTPLADEKVILDPSDPMGSARKCMAKKYADKDGVPYLHRYRGSFSIYDGSCYRQADEEKVRADIWTFCADDACAETKDGPAPFKPNREKVGNILDALQALSQLDGAKIEAPAWLDQRKKPNPLECLSCANGILHVPTGKLLPATPRLFCTSATDVAYDPSARAPGWDAFLKSIFKNDDEARYALQEFSGYCLTPNTSLQKMLLMVGPKRSGKGTFGRIMTGLLGGSSSVAAPTMSSLGDRFGLEPLITRPLAFISDARIGARTDKSAIVERLLSISGEDSLTIDRKHRDAWTGRLRTRFVILTNELPSLSDGSGALASRFVIITLMNSFYGKEDHRLEVKLKAELSGILNWAIEGYRRLMKRGHFIQPRSSTEALEQIEELASPVKAFLKSCCKIKPGLEADADELFKRWTEWCAKEGHKQPGSKVWFGRNLSSAMPGLRKVRHRDGDERSWAYAGIGLIPDPF